MGRISVDLSDVAAEPKENGSEAQRLKKLSSGLPSAGKARTESIRHAPRVQWSFTNVPAPIKQRAEVKAAEMGMGLKEFFYHCLRLGGVEVPSQEEIDGRRR